MILRLDWRLRLIIALVAVALVTWAGYSAYFALRQVRHLQLAREELRNGEPAQAAFFAQLVLQRNPRNPEAMKILGDLARRNGRPWEAIHWLGRRAEISPRDGDALLDFAQLLLQTNQTDAFRRVLEMAETLPDIGPHQGRLVSLKAQQALLSHDRAGAVKIYREWLDRSTAEDPIHCSLANVLAISTDPVESSEGRAMLLRFWEERRFPLETSRSLVALALKDQTTAQAGPWIECLQNDPSATLADHQLAGAALLQAGVEWSPDWLEKLATYCRSDLQIYQTLVWFRRVRRPHDALAWLQRLPPPAQRSPLVLLGRTEILAETGPWDRVTEILAGEDWGPMEHFRQSFLYQARTSIGTANRSETFALVGKNISRSLSRRPGDYFRLVDLMGHWGWSADKKEQILVEFSAALPDDPAVLLFLIREAETRRDTPALYSFGRRLLVLRPDHPAAKNNVALYGLLLGRDWEDCLRMTRELHERHPEIPGICLTRAFALLLENRTQDALNLVRSLAEKDLESPQAAMYAGLIFQAAGNGSEARKAWSRVRNPSKLLPEERAWMGLPNSVQPASPALAPTLPTSINID
jgi:tetratricopeptide (TPR) repeat protein